MLEERIQADAVKYQTLVEQKASSNAAPQHVVADAPSAHSEVKEVSPQVQPNAEAAPVPRMPKLQSATPSAPSCTQAALPVSIHTPRGSARLPVRRPPAR